MKRKANVYIESSVINMYYQEEVLPLRERLLGLVKNLLILPITNESRELAEIYRKYRRLPERDALHISIASLEGMDFLVTWNLRHMVKPGTQYMVRRVNMDGGLPVPQIVTPEDFFEEV